MPVVTISTCKAFHTEMPAAPSGPYLLDPDGDDGPNPPFMAHCDMTTEGGGWTVVFSPVSSDFMTQLLDYTVSPSERLLNDSTHVLLAYRDATNAMTPSNERAVFPLPQVWRVAAPFTYENMDIPVIVTVNGGSSVTANLRFGWKSFTASLCSDAWELSGPYGRLCIEGTSAPFYTAFAADRPDTCSDSSMNYDARNCGTSVRFTIAVR